MVLDKLRLGENFQRYARALTNTNTEAKPIRYIKTNGGRSFPFNIASGVPQGCPLSPLAFLLTAETLTRVINEDENIEGIIINGAELKSSRSANLQMTRNYWRQTTTAWPDPYNGCEDTRPC